MCCANSIVYDVRTCILLMKITFVYIPDPYTNLTFRDDFYLENCTKIDKCTD